MTQVPQQPQVPQQTPPAQPPASLPPAAYPPPWWAYPPKRRGWGRRFFSMLIGVIFVLSILVNIELLAVLFAGAGKGMDTSVVQEGEKSQTVALYTIGGVIGDKSAQQFNSFYDSIKNDGDVKAVVLRVDSPGGGIAASDEIYTDVRKIREKLKKPVIVSMGGVAASGGYYVSAHADTIYAEPTTITGSIGVIAVWPVIKDLLDKHGVNVITVRSNAADLWKARENFWENPPDRTRQEIQQMLDDMQARFDMVVKTGRKNLKIANKQVTVKDAAGKEVQVNEVEPLNGKTYLAEQAKSLGLIDEIGYLNDALEAAGRTANLSKPRIMQYMPRKSFREQLGLMEATTPISLDPEVADKLLAPRILMMWKVE